MIKHLKYHEIDFIKYTKCLKDSAQENWYAQKEVLDFWCPNWQLLVFNDYEAVMPVPVKKKWGFFFVSMPVFLQQLGIFSTVQQIEIDETFLKYLQNKFCILDYNFNCHNKFKTSLARRKNYVISEQDYSKLFSRKFSKGRKSVLNVNRDLVINEKKLDVSAANFIRTHFKGLKNKSEIEQFINFTKVFEEKLTFYSVESEGNILSLGVFLETDKSFGLLALINDEKFKSQNAPSFLINNFLKNNIKEKPLDFMGGNVRGIEVFFKSFGAELSDFSVIQHSKKQFIKKIIFK